MKAYEANKIANNVRTDQYGDIMEEIKKCANKGEFKAWWYKAINDQTRKMLEKDGYRVGPTTNDRNDLLTEISWT